MANNACAAGAWGAGCVGNGIADEGAALNAIGVYCAANPGQEFYVPAGAQLRVATPVAWTGITGLYFHGESMYSRVLDDLATSNMFTFTQCNMVRFDRLYVDLFPGNVRSLGASILVGGAVVNNSNMQFTNMVMIHTGYDSFVIDGGAFPVAGILLDTFTWLPGPGTPATTRSALRMANAADVIVRNVNCNYGFTLQMVKAALWLNGGLDTIGFTDTVWSQLGGTLGSGTGGVSLLVESTNGATSPQWVRFAGVNAFESNTGPCVQVDECKDLQFTGLYAVSGDEALVVNGGTVRVLGGTVGRCWHDVVQINGGDVRLVDLYVGGGSQASSGVYSGINVASENANVKISRPIIGKTDAFGPLAQMKYGIYTPYCNGNVTWDEPEFGSEVDAYYGRRSQ